MSPNSLQAQIKSIEVQLSVLKAQLTAGAHHELPTRRFADLYGIFAGKSDSSEDEIRAAEYNFDWDTSNDASEQ